MFLGHIAVALAAKRAAPKTSLGTLIAATQLADLLWPIMLLLGLEHVRIAPGITVVTPLDLYDFPITHSLLADLVWAALFGGAYFALRREARAAVVVALAVLSHWVLDFIAHRPDMPILPRGPYVGLEMWSSLPLTLAVELGSFALGVAVYLRATAPRANRTGLSVWIFAALFVGMYFMAVFGPPPPSESVIAWGGLSAWIFVAWAAWIDRGRVVRQLRAKGARR